MRMLFVSNYFPPQAHGGYEQLCQEVALAFAQRGHAVRILTSRPPAADPIDSPDAVAVHRVLHLEVVGGLLSTTLRLFCRRRRMEAENLEAAKAVLAEFPPDIALIWGMWNVPRAVPALIERLLPDRVVYYLCDYWPHLPTAYLQQWRAPSRRAVMRLAKRLLRPCVTHRLAREIGTPLKLERVICVSRALRDRLAGAGLPVVNAPVIHLGTAVEASRRGEGPGSQLPDARFSLVYVGRLVAEKGVHTIVEAVHLLHAELPRDRVTLDIFGAGDPAYVAALHAAVVRHRLQHAVRFRGRVDHSEVPVVLSRYDAFVLASEWDEPFSRALLEAMAIGLPVIGTSTGGTPEVVTDGVNGLLFRAGDAAMLAAQIGRLQRDPVQRRELAHAAQETVAHGFSLARTVNELEAALERIRADCAA